MINLKIIIAIVLLFLGMLSSVGISSLFSGKAEVRIDHTPPSLKDILKVKDLYIYRYVTSYYLSGKFDENLQFDENGKELKYVIVSAVDAFISLGEISTRIIDNENIVIIVQKINLNSIVNEDLSFPWKSELNIPVIQISDVQNIANKKLLAKAKEAGIMEYAMENTRVLLNRFYKNAGYQNVVIKFMKPGKLSHGQENMVFRYLTGKQKSLHWSNKNNVVRWAKEVNKYREGEIAEEDTDLSIISIAERINKEERKKSLLKSDKKIESP